MKPKRISFVNLTLACLLLTIAVSCGGENFVESPTTSQSRPPDNEPPSDGILRIGILLPLTDPSAKFGQDLGPVVESVTELLNEFQDLGGTPIEVVIRDEGTSTQSALAAAQDLIPIVDAVIGPFSALVAPSVTSSIVSQGLAVCSPSIAISAMNALQDDELFFRTSTLEIDLLSKMVDLAVQSGRSEVSIAFPDDPYGRNQFRFLEMLVGARELRIVRAVPYSPDAEQIDARLSTISSLSDEVILLIGEPISGQRILSELSSKSDGTLIITNDAFTTSEISFGGESQNRKQPQVYGVAPDVYLGNEALLSIFKLSTSKFLFELDKLPPYTTNTLDCLNIFWLASLSANSDRSSDLKQEIPSVVNFGSKCTWLFECFSLIRQGLNLDYEGVNSLTFDDLGNALDRPSVFFYFNSSGRAIALEGTPTFGFTTQIPLAPPP